MASNWTSLLTVVLVATGCTVGVVVLVCLALLGMSARAVSSAPAGGRSPASKIGPAAAALCLTAAAAIVLSALWLIVAT